MSQLPTHEAILGATQWTRSQRGGHGIRKAGRKSECTLGEEEKRRLRMKLSCSALIICRVTSGMDIALWEGFQGTSALAG